MSEENNTAVDAAVSRRSFIKSGAGAIVAAGCLHGMHAKAADVHQDSVRTTANNLYICPPCGLPCDKLSFDKAGACPGCGMTLVPANGEGGPPKVAILLYNGVEIIDIAGPWEVFGTAGLLVHTVAEKSDPVTLVFGQKTTPDYTFENSPKADVLLVPGGGYSESMKNEKLISWIQNKSKEVKYVMSVCTGAFLLGQAGLLAGQTATCTFGMVEDLAEFPNTKVLYDARYVESGKIITTAGLTAGIDGALRLVSKILSKGAAQLVALSMEYHWQPEGEWARGGLADRFLPEKRLQGAQAKLISTEGDATRWETKLLVSEPKTTSNIIDLLRERITARAGIGGMMNIVRHLRSGPTFVAANNNSELRWNFTDDAGRKWTGAGVVAPAPESDKFLVTLSVARL